MVFNEAIAERFWRKVDKSKGQQSCWAWLGAVTPSGYGLFGIGGKSQRAHRISWQITNGRMLTPNEFVCHECDNPQCVNPTHLRAGDHSSNMAEMKSRGRHAFHGNTHCKNGHPYIDYGFTRSDGFKGCLECRRNGNRRRRSKQSGFEERIAELERELQARLAHTEALRERVQYLEDKAATALSILKTHDAEHGAQGFLREALNPQADKEGL